MIDGKLTRMDADDVFTGEIASMSFDFSFTVIPNQFKQADRHPDYIIEAKSPKNRVIRIGSAWAAKSRAGNDYLSLALNLSQGVVRTDAVKDEETGEGEYRIIPLMSDAA